MRRFLRYISIFFCLLIPMVFLSGCASTSQEGSANARLTSQATCTYANSSDTTRVSFVIQINNESIYDISNESFQFSLYKDDSIVETKYYKYSIKVKASKSITNSCYFDYNGQIDSAVFVSWNCEYSSFWNTYSAWMITTIVIVSILIVLFIIAELVTGFEFHEDVWDFIEDIFDDFEDHWWTLIILAAPYIPYLITSLVQGTWNWVPAAIITGGIVSIPLGALLIILIGYIIYGIVIAAGGIVLLFAGFGEHKNRKNKRAKKNKQYDEIVTDQNKEFNDGFVEEYLDDVVMLADLDKKQLVTYCINHHITGYSNKNKKQLAALIYTYHQENPNNEHDSSGDSKESKKTTKKRKSNKITFDDIAGLDEAKNAFNEKVVMPLQHPEIYAKYSKKVGGGILLYGLPGTGKTMFAEAASNELNALFIPIKCSDIKSKWYGESEQNVKNIFAKARKASKVILFFDEFEAIGAKRTDNSDNGNNDLVPQILAEMQGVGSSSSKSMIMVIAATNKPWAIDSAFLRPGRFDEKIYIPLPDFTARKKLFELKLSKIPTDNVDLDYLSNITEGYNGADIEEFVEKLKQTAINESIKSGKDHLINMDDIKKVETTMHSSVSKEDIERLKEFQSQF